MRCFLKQRIRVLVVCVDPMVENLVVSLLTGFEFYVDYVDNMPAALERFKTYRHPVVLLDQSLPKVSLRRLPGYLRMLQRDCLVVAIAQPGQGHEITRRMDGNYYDIVELPVTSHDLLFRVRRLLKQHENASSIHFLRLLGVALLQLFPPLLALAWYLK